MDSYSLFLTLLISFKLFSPYLYADDSIHIRPKESDFDQEHLKSTSNILYGKNWKESLLQKHKKDQRNQKVILQIADAYYLDKDYVNSKKYLKKLLKLNFHHTDASLKLARILNEENAPKGALLELKRIKIDKIKNITMPYFYFERGKSYFLLGEKAKAYEDFDKAFESKTPVNHLKILASTLLKSAMEFSKAEAYLKDIIASNPKATQAYFELGEIYFLQKLEEKSRINLNQFLERSKKSKNKLFLTMRSKALIYLKEMSKK